MGYVKTTHIYERVHSLREGQKAWIELLLWILVTESCHPGR